jgi:hypothetical protein
LEELEMPKVSFSVEVEVPSTPSFNRVSEATRFSDFSRTRFGRGTPRLKARMVPVTYQRCNGDVVPVATMHDFHIVNAVAEIRREKAQGIRARRHAGLADLLAEARLRGYTVE